MRSLSATIFVASILAASSLAASALSARADIRIVASIKPVHSLVSGVMKGVAEPELIIDGAGSPHTYALKPSQAAMLERADVVFWMGPELEAFLVKPLRTLASSARSVGLLDAGGLVKLQPREGGAFEAHDHGAEASGDHHEGHDHHHAAHAHGEKHHHRHKTEGGDHHHDDFDPHVWLDPVNAKTLVGEIRAVLAASDPANAALYDRNAAAMTRLLDDLVVEINAQLRPVHGRGFIVFHDAYQYFERRFDVRASGSLTVSPEVMPGARRISELRAKVRELNVTCVFSEPQFTPKLISAVVEGTSARSAVLDPLGSSLTNGPNLYFALIRNMAAAFRSCLSNSG